MGGGGGGQQPTQTSVQNTNIPDYARPYVETMLGAAQQQIFNYEPDANGNMVATGFKEYKPFSENPADYFAGFSPMQETSFQGAADLYNQGPSWQLGQGSNIANAAALRALNTQYTPSQFSANQVTAPQLTNYQMQAPTDVAAQQGVAPTMQAAQTNYAPNLQTFQMGPAERVDTQSFNQPGTAADYMSPYMQNVVDIQKREAQRASDIQGTQQAAQAVKAGAFGGSRAGIVEAERQRNLAQQLGDIQATGSQAAFQNAQQQFNAEQNRALQAAQGNQQAGLTTGQQNLAAQLGVQQLGTQAGLQTALQNLSNQQQAAVQNQAAQLQTQGLNQQQALQAALANQQMGYNVGAQNLAANLGVQQLGSGQNMTAQQLNQAAGLQAQQLTEQSRQYGAGLGLQGLQTGLQGAGQLGNLGQAQYGQQVGNINLLNQMGAQQQGFNQNIINQQIQDYAMQQQYPMLMLSNMSNLLRGLPMQSTTTQMYQAAPSAMSQLGGLGTAAYGAYKMFGSKKGGKVPEPKKKVAKYSGGGLVELAISKI